MLRIKCTCQKRIDLTTSADRPLNKHVVLCQNIVNLVTGRRLCSLIRKCFSKDNATFTGPQKLFLFILFFMIQACAIGLRGVSTVLRTV